MTRLILLVLVVSLASCSHHSQREKTKAQKEREFRDSLETEERVAIETEKFLSSLKWDTVGVANCGIIITDADFIEEEYSNYKSVRLRYKNVSGKKIKAIKFKWNGIDAFGDPADCGSLTDEGFGGGFVDDPLGTGRSRTSVWGVLSRNGDQITKAWVTEIAFDDGTKWKSSWR